MPPHLAQPCCVALGQAPLDYSTLNKDTLAPVSELIRLKLVQVRLFGCVHFQLLELQRSASSTVVMNLDEFNIDKMLLFCS